MMKHKLGHIAMTGSSLMATLMITLIGADFLDLPHYAVKYAGPSGYWSIGIAFILILPVVWVAQGFQKRFPGQNFFEIAPQVIGRPGALIGNVCFLGSFLARFILSIRDGVDLILIYLLNRTPFYAVLLLLLISIGYVAISGLAAVNRFINFLFIPVVLFRFIMKLLSLQKMETSHLLPLFSATPFQYLLGGLTIIGYLLPVTTIFLISSQLKQSNQLQKPVFGALVLTFPIYILGFLGTVGSFGTAYTQLFAWPEITTINHIHIPFLVLEQVGLLFLIVWITTFFATMIFYAAIIATGLTQQFSRLNYSWSIWIILSIAGIVAFCVPNAMMARDIYTNLRPWTMIPVTVYPLAIYGIAWLRGKGGADG